MSGKQDNSAKRSIGHNQNGGVTKSNIPSVMIAKSEAGRIAKKARHANGKLHQIQVKGFEMPWNYDISSLRRGQCFWIEQEDNGARANFVVEKDFASEDLKIVFVECDKTFSLFKTTQQDTYVFIPTVLRFRIMKKFQNGEHVEVADGRQPMHKLFRMIAENADVVIRFERPKLVHNEYPGAGFGEDAKTALTSGTEGLYAFGVGEDRVVVQIDMYYGEKVIVVKHVGSNIKDFEVDTFIKHNALSEKGFPQIPKQAINFLLHLNRELEKDA